MDNEKEGYVIVEWADGFKVPIEERGDFYQHRVYLNIQDAVDALKTLCEEARKDMVRLYPNQLNAIDYVQAFIDLPKFDLSESRYTVFNGHEIRKACIHRFTIQ